MISAFFLVDYIDTVSKLEVIYSYNILCSYFSENVKDFMYLRTQDDIRLYILHVSRNANLYKFIWFYNIYIFISHKKNLIQNISEYSTYFKLTSCIRCVKKTITVYFMSTDVLTIKIIEV